MTVENIDKVETIGEPLVFTIEKGETLLPGENFPANSIIELSEVHVGNEEGVVFVKGRRFVPSFDNSKTEEEQILAWSNKDEEGHDRVFVSGKFHIPTNALTVTGEGFEKIVVKVYEYRPATEA